MLKKICIYLKKKLIREKIVPIKIPVCEGGMLKGKKTLIIGGSGGIGTGIAQCFVKNGAEVLITGTNKEKLIHVCETLEGQVQYFNLDVMDVKHIDINIKNAVETLEGIDILVYCAGVHGLDIFGKVSEKTWDQVLDINLKGMYFVCQAVSNYMIKHGIKGHILTIGSASCAKPGWTPYEISKWGVRGLTLGLADKLISHGIIVNSIAPGPVATAMLGRETGDNLIWPGNPSGRMCSVEEIGNLAVVMVSDLGNMIVGDTFFISGGSGTVCIDK